MRRWQQRGLKDLKVAVNLSAAQLRDPSLKQTIQRTLERHRLRPASLELELTETAATEDAERTFALFGELRALGVSLAIDDFGSGYSSLSYLKNLPFDKLKIDREFVVDVHLRRDSQAICRSLVELTRGLGLADPRRGRRELGGGRDAARSRLHAPSRASFFPSRLIQINSLKSLSIQYGGGRCDTAVRPGPGGRKDVGMISSRAPAPTRVRLPLWRRVLLAHRLWPAAAPCSGPASRRPRARRRRRMRTGAAASGSATRSRSSTAAMPPPRAGS